MLKNLLLVFIGGGMGSVLRFGVSLVTRHLPAIGNFPIATFIVNILGCFLIGLFAGFSESSQWKFLLAVGFCGGFTTFSTFSMESLALYRNGQFGTMAIYVAASLLVGFAAAALGYYLKNYSLPLN